MRKIFTISCLVAVFLLTAVSCSDDDSESAGTGNSETVELSLTASATRSSLLNEKVYWNPDDALKVYDASGAAKLFTNAATDVATTAKFTCKTWDKEQTPLWAFYNGSAEAPVMKDAATGKFVAEVPAVQSAVSPGTFGDGANLSVGKILPAVAGGGYEVEMKNICGLVKFDLANSGSDLMSIALSDAGGTKLAGKVEIDCTDGVPACSVVEGEGQETVTFTCRNAAISDGTYYFCLLPGTITPCITFIRADGSMATLRMETPVEITRSAIVSLGIIDRNIEFNDTRTLSYDFLDWNAGISHPQSGMIAAASEIQEFYTSEGYLLYSSAGLGRSAELGFYSYRNVSAGTYITLPALPGMKLMKVFADLGGTVRNGYPSNSGAPFIATSEGIQVTGGDPASDYEFIKDGDQDSDPYLWNLSGTRENTSYRLQFTDNVTGFGLQALKLVYKGTTESADVAAVATGTGESPAAHTVLMKGSFRITENASYADFHYGFRYRYSDADAWTYAELSDHNGGSFTKRLEQVPSGEFIYCAWAGYGDNADLRRYGVPVKIAVTGGVETYATVDFTSEELQSLFPASTDQKTDETVFTVDGHDYKVSGQETDAGKVFYYRYNAERGLYFNRTTTSVDGNACGFIELPAEEGYVLKSIDIVDVQSTKTYRVYAEKRAVYDHSDTNHLGSVTNDRTAGKVTLEVTGAVAGTPYYLCCPIFSYVKSITVTYEK